MAARENQGLQIALIIFVMLTILLSVTTYLFNDHKIKAYKELDQAVAEKNKANELAADTLRQTSDYFEIIGEAPPEQGQEKNLVEKHKKIMTDFIALAGLTDSVKPNNYPVIIAEMAKAVKDKDAKLLAFQQQAEKAVADLNAEKAKFTTEIQTVKSDKEKAKGDYAAQGKSWVDEVKTLAVSKVEAEKSVAASIEATEKAKSDLSAATKKFKNDAAKYTDAIKIQQAEIQKFSDPRPTLTDGRVIAVDERTKTCTVDIGSADALQRRVTFSVYDRSTNDVGTAVKKGAIEIIEILGPKMARARIFENSISDPILAGDFIDSLLWYPGKKQKFAVAGFIDFDNDGVSDRSKLLDIIIANGGTIVADVNERGESNGQITVDTASLIVGKTTDTQLRDVKFQKAWSSINEDATKFSIPKVQLAKFLDNVGYTPTSNYSTGDVQSQRLIDTQIKNQDGSNQLLNPTFRERTPPTPGKNGAYGNTP